MKEKKTHFTKRVRIRKDQLEWIRINKPTKTMAGFLDIIINKYKNEQTNIKNIQVEKGNNSNA